MTNSDSTYSPGAWYALVAPFMAVLVDPQLPSARLDAVWDVVLAARGVDAAVALLAPQPPGEASSFALAGVEGDMLRLVIHGPVSVTVQDGDGERDVTASGADGWHDETMKLPTAVWFTREGAREDGSALPVICGVVGADVIGWQPGASPEQAAHALQPVQAGAAAEPPATGGWPMASLVAANGDHDGSTRMMAADAPPRAVLLGQPAAGATDAAAPVRFGLLHFSTGQVVDVAGPIVVGRAPAQPEDDDEVALLVPVRGAGRGISRNHVKIGVDDVGPYAIDLGSRNGTVVSFPGSSTVPLEAEVAYRLVDGAIVTIADVSFEYRALVFGA